MQKFIITKYALTTGIFSAIGNVCTEAGHGRMIEVNGSGFFHKPDWHTTVEEAVARVQVMREASRKSLIKKIAKLESMDIEAAVRAVAT